MNYDRAVALVTELRQNEERNEEIRRELMIVFGGEESAPSSSAGKGEGRAARRKKGELTALVAGLLRGYTRPAKLDTIAKRVQAQRPGTTQASVATVLHGLVRKQVVEKPEPSTFQLRKTPAAPAAEKQARGPRKAAQAPPVVAPEPVVRAEPAAVEEEGVLIES